MNLVQKINTVVFYGNIDFVERERELFIYFITQVVKLQHEVKEEYICKYFIYKSKHRPKK